jgi:uncharacterized protein YndB with AHSA1/START domain
MFEKIASINWLAVLAAGFAMFMIGGVWYGAVFSKLWHEVNGISAEQLAERQKRMSPAKFFPSMIASYVVAAFAMGLLIVNLDIKAAGPGAVVGAVLWLFATAAIGMTDKITLERKPLAFVLDGGYQLIAFAAGGAVLGMWRQVGSVIAAVDRKFSRGFLEAAMKIASRLVSVAFVCMLGHAADAAERILRHEGVIHAPAAEVYSSMTTGEGLKKLWGVAHAEVEFKVGGRMLTNYDPAGKIGDDNTITNTILAYEPGRMVAIKPGAPKDAPEHIKAICETGWSVIRLEPLTPTSTRLTITGMGYKEGELFDKAYEFFNQGNAWTLAKMQEAMNDKTREARNERIANAWKSMLGTWEFSQKTPKGDTFRGRSTIAAHFGGRVIFASGFLGNDKKLGHHSHFTAGVDPESGEWMVWNFDQDGSLTRGPVHFDGDTMVVDWTTANATDGKLIDYRVEYVFHEDGEYTVRVLTPPEKNGSRGTIAEVRYKKVGDAVQPASGAEGPAK